jgi:hypothetical protein
LAILAGGEVKTTLEAVSVFINAHHRLFALYASYRQDVGGIFTSRNMYGRSRIVIQLYPTSTF